MNQSNAHRVSVYGANLKAVIGRFEDLRELRFAPLFCTKYCHHAEVDLPQVTLLVFGHCAWIWKHNVVDEERCARSTALQRRDVGAQHPDAIFVIVVMQTLPDQERRGIVDRLGLEKVMLLKRNSAAYYLGCLGQHYWGYVLDDKLE